MILGKYVYCLCVLVFGNLKLISSATFENVSIVLRSINTNQIVVISSGNHLSSYGNISNADEITITRQNIPKLTENCVANLPKVEDLTITRCGLTEIRPGAFNNLPKLKVLNLSYNSLKTIKNGVFTNLNFHTLYLEDNQIAKIENKAFNNLAMTSLFIDNNQIATWNSEWFNGTPVTGISMGGNLIETLPRRSFEFLWQFRARGVSLRLAFLVLNNNRIKRVDPDAFEGLNEISNLNLQDNLLEHLEPGLFDSVGEIYTLQLSDNQIKEIYYEVFRNTKLANFEVKNNLLSCISTDIFSVTDLEEIYVDGNPLTCDCLKTWEEYVGKNDKPVIDNFYGLNKDCSARSVASSCGKHLLLTSLLISRFIFK